ncbi:MAG: 30S ribosomal protein S17 [bacterium]|nr:30S ribosomal protein S17 [bacterium]
MRERGRRKVREGKVLSNRMNKTVVVSIERLVKHPFYGKVVRKRAKCYAHDEANQCQIGDKVKIMETRPLSRLKRWRVVERVEA